MWHSSQITFLIGSTENPEISVWMALVRKKKAKLVFTINSSFAKGVMLPTTISRGLNKQVAAFLGTAVPWVMSTDREFL